MKPYRKMTALISAIFILALPIGDVANAEPAKTIELSGVSLGQPWDSAKATLLGKGFKVTDSRVSHLFVAGVSKSDKVATAITTILRKDDIQITLRRSLGTTERPVHFIRFEQFFPNAEGNAEAIIKRLVDTVGADPSCGKYTGMSNNILDLLWILDANWTVQTPANCTRSSLFIPGPSSHLDTIKYAIEKGQDRLYSKYAFASVVLAVNDPERKSVQKLIIDVRDQTIEVTDALALHADAKKDLTHTPTKDADF